MIRAIQLLFGLASILGGGALLWFRPGAENGLFDLANKDGLWMAVVGLILVLFGLMLMLMGVSSRAKVSKINRYQPGAPKAFPDPIAPHNDQDDAILRKTPAPVHDETPTPEPEPAPPLHDGSDGGHRRSRCSCSWRCRSGGSGSIRVWP